MFSPKAEDRQKLKKDWAKRAIALAMKSRWSDAVSANLSLLIEFPEDLEAYNRLGKALTELGRAQDAKDAFTRALEISPHNPIARKNLDRLTQLGDEAPRLSASGRRAPQAFIEESGKAGVTSLLDLPLSKTLLKLSPGDAVQLELSAASLRATAANGEHVGKVEPRLASRLTRLIKGGNRYEATVTAADEHELTVIIRETYQHPSQAGTASFPSRIGADNRAYLPNARLGYEPGEDDGGDTGPIAVKDWSDDDTEPGDDDAFSPVVHRIINAGDESAGQDEEE